MPFELGGALRGGAEWTCGRPVFYGVLRNPIFTAALITALALVIIFALYRAELRRSGWQLGVKTAFWVLVAVTGVVFVHYYALEKYFSKEHGNQGVREVVGAVQASALGGGGYRIPLADEAATAPREGYPGEYRRPPKPARRYGAAEEEDGSGSGSGSGSDSGSGDSEDGDGSSGVSAAPSTEEGDAPFSIQDAVLPSSRAPAPPAKRGGGHHRMAEKWRAAPPKKHKGHRPRGPYAPHRR